MPASSPTLPVPIPLADIREARLRIAATAIRTPLVRLDVDGIELYAKLENLQPIGSFKVRGASNAMALADPATLRDGVYTASAGNMAQGVAWAASRLGIPCAVVVPDHAPRAKLDAVERLGARIVPVTFDRWLQVLADRGYPGMEGLFIHPFADRAVIAGNATIGLEIIEELPDVASVIVPYGGGGLSGGIASAVKSVMPGVTVFAAEADTAAPLAAALEAGRPAEVDYTPSWVDGMGSRSVFPDMWPMVSALLDGSIVVSLDQIADAVRLLVSRARVVAEGAGAAPIAAALTGRAGTGPVVAVVSGGNLDGTTLATILRGATR
jgi:threonine dehydratase